jgi:hypothetical protein
VLIIDHLSRAAKRVHGSRIRTTHFVYGENTEKPKIILPQQSANPNLLKSNLGLSITFSKTPTIASVGSVRRVGAAIYFRLLYGLVSRLKLNAPLKRLGQLSRSIKSNIMQTASAYLRVAFYLFRGLTPNSPEPPLFTLGWTIFCKINAINLLLKGKRYAKIIHGSRLYIAAYT